MTVHELREDHIGLDIESLDRIYLNGDVPNLTASRDVLAVGRGACVKSPFPGPGLVVTACAAGLRCEVVVDGLLFLSRSTPELGRQVHEKCAPETSRPWDRRLTWSFVRHQGLEPRTR